MRTTCEFKDFFCLYSKSLDEIYERYLEKKLKLWLIFMCLLGSLFLQKYCFHKIMLPLDTAAVFGTWSFSFNINLKKKAVTSQANDLIIGLLLKSDNNYSLTEKNIKCTIIIILTLDDCLNNPVVLLSYIVSDVFLLSNKIS